MLYKFKNKNTSDALQSTEWDNYEVVETERGDIIVGDVAGQDQLRIFWRNHYRNLDAIIYVVDAGAVMNDDQFNRGLLQSKARLHFLLKEAALTRADIPFVIASNKHDLPIQDDVAEWREASAASRKEGSRSEQKSGGVGSTSTRLAKADKDQTEPSTDEPLTEDEIYQIFEIDKLKDAGINCTIISTIATTGYGLDRIIEWLTANMPCMKPDNP